MNKVIAKRSVYINRIFGQGDLLNFLMVAVNHIYIHQELVRIGNNDYLKKSTCRDYSARKSNKHPISELIEYAVGHFL